MFPVFVIYRHVIIAAQAIENTLSLAGLLLRIRREVL
jgi:hypothetical protein